MKYILLSLTALSTIGCANSSYYYQNGKKHELKPATSTQRSVQNHDLYKTENGSEVGVNNTLLVQFLNDKNLSSYAKELGFKVVKKLAPNLYKLEVKNRKLTIPTANALYEKADVKFAHPNFLRKVGKR